MQNSFSSPTPTEIILVQGAAGRSHEVGIVPISENEPIGRNNAKKVRETAGDILQVAKDVSVIEFQIIQNEDLGPIVDKFAALCQKKRSHTHPPITKGDFEPPRSLPEGRSRGTPR